MSIRPARNTHDDSHFVYHVSMLDSVLRYSTRGQFYRFSEHEEWWARRITDSDQMLFIIENDETPVGYVRWGYTTTNFASAAECSIAIADEHRGCGFAYEGLVASIDKVRQRWPDILLIALVLPDNIASLRLFEKAGFKRVGDEERMGKQHIRLERA